MLLYNSIIVVNSNKQVCGASLYLVNEYVPGFYRLAPKGLYNRKSILS